MTTRNFFETFNDDLKFPIEYFFISPEGALLGSCPLEYGEGDMTPAEVAIEYRNKHFPEASIAVTVSEYITD